MVSRECGSYSAIVTQSLSIGLGDGILGIANASSMMTVTAHTEQAEVGIGAGISGSGVSMLANGTTKSFLSGMYDAASVDTDTHLINWEEAAMVGEAIVNNRLDCGNCP